MNRVHDVIVVGSGACGSMAAQTLVEAGRSVLMVDGGRRDDRYASIIPDQGFSALRRSDPQQHRYFLGDGFESLERLSVKTGAQLTPPRRFLVRDVERYLGVRSDEFSPLESLARGGLAAGWGLGCAVFSPEELALASLPTQSMHDAYQVVADRIGISGSDDDARPFTSAHIRGVQPALPIDPTANVLLRNYDRQRTALRGRGFRIGRPAMALLSADKDGRRGSLMHDMEFYVDHGRSAWRAWITVDALTKCENFAYEGDSLVLRFAAEESTVALEVLDLAANERRVLHCRNLVLAAGALGSARIVLRSQGSPDTPVPLLCNPYTYLPCLVPSRLGHSMPERNSALSQLAIFHDKDGGHHDVAMGFVYSYRSLMLFRLMREVPLQLRAAPAIMRFLLSGFLIVGIHHPHSNGGGSYARLETNTAAPTGDRLFVKFELTGTEQQEVEVRERAFAACLRYLGAYPVRRVRPGFGASIHYGGTLPASASERPLTTSINGRLHGIDNVYVADSSSFTFLPAKGVTLSAMARAHCVAAHLLQQ